jgi:hypothetical protein
MNRKSVIDTMARHIAQGVNSRCSASVAEIHIGWWAHQTIDIICLRPVTSDDSPVFTPADNYLLKEAFSAVTGTDPDDLRVFTSKSGRIYIYDARTAGNFRQNGTSVEWKWLR